MNWYKAIWWNVSLEDCTQVTLLFPAHWKAPSLKRDGWRNRPGNDSVKVLIVRLGEVRSHDCIPILLPITEIARCRIDILLESVQLRTAAIQTNVFTVQNRIELTWQGTQWPILWVCEWVQLKCRIEVHSYLPESFPLHLHRMRIPLTSTSSSMQANLLAKTGMPAPNMSTTFMGKSRPEVLVCRDTPTSAAARMIG